MSLLQDFYFALRTFKKAPLFVFVAVLSLAFGIGANTAIFTLTDQLLLRSLPVVNPEQLVYFSAMGHHYGSNSGPNRISYPMYQDFRDHTKDIFSGMFCFREEDFSLSDGGRTERVSGEAVSGNYFPVLGVTASVGRLFTANDDLHQKGHPIAVLSYGYWKSRFGGNSSVIGRTLHINGYPFTVIGVSPPGFAGTDPGFSPQVRIPMMMEPVTSPYVNLNDRRTRWITAFARLRTGVSLASAKAAIQPYFHQLLNMEVQQKEFAKAAPDMKKRFLQMSMDLMPGANGRSGLRRQFSTPLLVLMGTVLLVLLIACANVANLLIARATFRQKEIAVRLALGSSRFRIIRQLLVESLMLSVAGGLIGLGMAMWADRILILFLPPATSPLAISATPDWRILAFTTGVSLLTGILFGLVPALQSTKADVARTLKDNAGAVVGGASATVRKVLVTAQIALSLMLLIAASLFIRSLQNLKELDPGFRTANLLAFKVDPSLNSYSTDRTKAFYQTLRENLAAIPGVENAALAVVPVMEGDEWDSWVTIDSYSPKSGETPDPHMNYTTPDYFKTMEINLLAGRDFRRSDNLKSGQVCMVNATFAKKYFGSVNAVGHKVGMGVDPGTKTDITIVGVFHDTKYESLRDEVPTEMIRPIEQLDFASGVTAYIRTTQRPDEMFPTIQKRMRDLDPNLPVYEMITLEHQTENSLVTERLVATLSSGFGFLSTGLASIGLYGMLAYTVGRRTREIGIRMAIGAAQTDVLWLVMREVVLLLMVGVAFALPASWALGKYVQSQLYGIQSGDPMSIALAVVAIAIVATLSGYLPARRATKVDPMLALRYE